MMFRSRQKQIQEQLTLYNEQILLCMDIFQKAINDYCEDPDRTLITERAEKVHHAEGLADDLRRDIEVMMYRKALFPESRGDILGLLESMDRVPNHAESTVHMIISHHIVIPKELSNRFRSLVDITCRCVNEMIKAVESLFKDFVSASLIVGKIDELESEADHVEDGLFDRIFSSSMDGIEKILLRDLTRRIAGISDRAENVGDRIRIMVAKRSI